MADIGPTCCSGIRGVCVWGGGVRDRPTTLMRCPVTQVGLLYSKPSVIQPSIKYQNKKMIIVYCMLYLYIRLNTRKQIMMSHYATNRSYKTYNCFPAFHFGTFCHLYFLHISQTNRAVNLSRLKEIR